MYLIWCVIIVCVCNIFSSAFQGPNIIFSQFYTHSSCKRLEGMFPPFLCRFCVVSWKIASNFQWMDKSGKKVAVNVLLVMGNNFRQYPRRPTQSGTVPLFVEQFHIFQVMWSKSGTALQKSGTALQKSGTGPKSGSQFQNMWNSDSHVGLISSCLILLTFSLTTLLSGR
jgi:hypothetical protein